ncbi:MAG: HAD family hydrolase [Nitrososphaeraceae archaeon]
MNNPSSYFLFFDLGQTLINEWEMIRYLDSIFLELLEGFGTKIDRLNYIAIRNNVIRNRIIGNGDFEELIFEVCKLLRPEGYGRLIFQHFQPHIQYARQKHLTLYDDALPTLTQLRKKYQMGIIANQSGHALSFLQKYGIIGLFEAIVFSSQTGFRKPDRRIFEAALLSAGKSGPECVMIGDRLDTDIKPANELGMKTIRITNSLFSQQEPLTDNEHPTLTIKRLREITSEIVRIG